MRFQDNEYIKQVGELIATQDNRITADPIFIVQQKRRVHGVEHDYTETFSWLNVDDPEDAPSEIEEAGLELLDSQGKSIDGWRKVGYLDHWEFVTACFTEKGCEDYIRVNGHNLNEPRIYVDSAYRNKEFNTIRKLIVESAKETA